MDLRTMLRAAGLADRGGTGDGAAERARAYFQVAGVMLVVVGRDHRLREINRRGLEILGYDRADEIVGRDWLEVCLPPAARPDAAAWLDRFLAGDPAAPSEGSFEVRRRDGGTRLIAWRHALLRDAQGRAIAKVSSGEDVTAQRDSAARFQVLAETVPGLLFTTDAAGATTFVNRSYTDYSGCTVEDLVGDGWTRLVHPDDLPQVLEAWKRSVETGTEYVVDGRMRRRDGVWRWHLCRGLPLRDSAGQITQWFGIAVDIDDRKRAEAAAQQARETLATAERRQRLLLDLSERQRPPTDPEQALQAAVAVLGEVLGVDRVCYAEITPDRRHAIIGAEWIAPASGRSPMARMHSLSGHWQVLLPALEKGEIVRLADAATDPRTQSGDGKGWARQYRGLLAVPLARRDGPFGVLFAVSGAPRPWSEECVALAAAVAERTWAAVERARAELALRASEERLSLAMEASGLATWDVDLGSGRRVWSPSHYLLLGLDPATAEASAPSWRERVIAEDLPLVEAAVEAARAGDGSYHAEYRIRRADTGEERWMLSRGRFLRDGSGLWRRFVGISLDVTERHRTEEALRDAAQELEARVAARTAELAAARDRLVAEAIERERLEEQLRQTQKLQAVGQLAGGIAHDFNNLLTAVLGSLELLERHVATDAGRRLLNSARMAAERGGTLTNQLLAFARRQKLSVRPVDVADLVRRMDEMLRRTLGGFITLRIDAPDLPCTVETDPVQLELSVLNLVINARDAMPAGGTLTVSVQSRQPSADMPDLAPGSHAVVAVADTGAGMPPEVRARAFEPFFTTKEVGRGTGLGLAQVYGVARQCGGTARILSAPGEGTRVEIWLPCTDGTPARAGGDAARAGGAETAPVAAILLADDEEQVRAFAAEVLRDAGYDVIEAPDGAAALAVLSGGARVDLLVTDFAMPGMTGLGLIEAARRQRPGLRALLVSGYAGIEGPAGASDAQLRKPFRGADLRAAVAELLAAPRHAPPQAEAAGQPAICQPLVAPAVNPAM
ncbi:MAG TPA: PAS domain-containing protein [Acetobacteraceae bacterium]|nr:PAS domain-containing protein [Acetobacteraceae bacterium]